jgi:hypothetical protein
LASTSGTVSQTPFPIRKIVDSAMRRAGYQPQKVTAEGIAIALDLLFSLTSEWANVGVPLWTRVFSLGSVTIGSPEVQAPDGTVDVLDAYWRILRPYRGSAVDTAAADVSDLFAGEAVDDVTIAAPNPGVIVNFGSATELDTVGVLLGTGAAITTALQVLTSDDGVTYSVAQTLPSATYSAGSWVYFDLNPTISAQYVQLRYAANAPWVLQQVNFGLANGQDITLGLLSIDDYYAQPNKLMQTSQPNSCFIDRAYPFPNIKLWPVPDTGAFYNGTVSLLTRRYIQDPGTMADNLEVPQRWNEAVIWRLGVKLIDELPNQMAGLPDQLTLLQMQDRGNRRQTCSTEAARSEALAWGEERTPGPIQIAPYIGCYTRR